MLFGLMAPFAAVLINRYGMRRIAASRPLALIVSGLLVSLAMTRVLAARSVVGRGHRARHRHDRAGAGRHRRDKDGSRRGAALVTGLLTASSATGQLVFPAAAGQACPNVSAGASRSSWFCGALALVVTAVLPLFLLRDRPADVGLEPFGQTEGAAAAGRPGPCPGPDHGVVCPARRPAGPACSGFCFGTFFICGASTSGLIQTHFIPLCADFGLPAVGAAGVSCGDGPVRYRRHHRVGLAVRPLRQPLAAVLVLRLARAVADLSAVHGIHVLTDCRCSRCSTASIGSRRCRPTVKLTVCPLRPRGRANLVFGWIFAGHQLGRSRGQRSAPVCRAHGAIDLSSGLLRLRCVCV